MPEYQLTLIRIFKSIWLIVHLQNRKKKKSQRFYFAPLRYYPTIKDHSKLTCFKKKKKRKEELQHSFHTPTRPRGSSTSFLWLFLEASMFFSRPATKDVFEPPLRFVCVTDFMTLSRKCYLYLHRLSRTLSWVTVSKDYFCFCKWIFAVI